MSMFVASILAVGVCPPGDVAIYPTPNDVRLMIAQEDFFIDAAPPGLRNLEDRFPDTTFPLLVRMLGCEHSEHREYVRDQLLSMGPVAIPPLAWGRRHKDRHVAHMCEIMLDAFCPCSLCEGTGYLHNRRWDSRKQRFTSVSWTCYHCGGDGSVR